MNSQTVKLSENSSADIEIFISENCIKNSPFIIIVPGGGYDHYGWKEQETVARFFNGKGFNAAVLHYTIAPMKFGQALTDLAQAVSYIRGRQDLCSNSRVAVVGFSAGGHLTGCLGAWWNNSSVISYLNKKWNCNLKCSEIKPDLLCLCYPVISADEKISHKGSFLRLTENLSENEKQELLQVWKAGKTEEFLSLENQVTEEFPPVFMWHTREDKAVPAENTLRMALSLQQKQIDFEYHLFEQGPHGLSLGENSEAEIWPELFINFMARLMRLKKQ